MSKMPSLKGQSKPPQGRDRTVSGTYLPPFGNTIKALNPPRKKTIWPGPRMEAPSSSSGHCISDKIAQEADPRNLQTGMGRDSNFDRPVNKIPDDRRFAFSASPYHLLVGSWVGSLDEVGQHLHPCGDILETSVFQERPLCFLSRGIDSIVCWMQLGRPFTKWR